MRLRRVVVVFGGMILLVLLFPTLAITNAQDGTPSPDPIVTTPVPTFLPTQDPASVIARVPFTETFDTDQGWEAEGAWRYEPLQGETTGAWFVDSHQRETVSILTYQSSIDLNGVLNARLLYRQNGHLTSSDFVAAEISLDGGATWLLLDMQVGVDAAWDLQTVDLSKYRGQVVRLRFRVQTGRLPDEVDENAGYYDDTEGTYKPTPTPTVASPTESATEAGADGATVFDVPDAPVVQTVLYGDYGIDNLTIQFFEVPQELAMLPLQVYRRTLMGLHLVVGAQGDPVISLAKRLNDIGWPLGTLKGTSGTESILNAVARSSPETVIVYRSLETPWGLVDCPNEHTDPVAEAQRWISGLQPYWDRVDADYYELMNECLPSAEWLTSFTIEAMRLAQLYSECLLVFSFPPGNPDPGYYQALWPVYEYALANPCQPGRYHGVALHAYGIERTRLVSETDTSIGLRHRLFYNDLIQSIPQSVYLDVYVTEMGQGDGATPFTCEDIARDVITYTRQLEHDPYVRGFHLWNLGLTQQFVDITECMPVISDALVTYYSAK